MLKLSERYLTILVILAMAAVVIYPIRLLTGVSYFVVISLFTLFQKEVRRSFLKRVLPFVPAIVIFGMLPFLFSLFTRAPEIQFNELLFGAGIIGKGFTILMLLSFLMNNVSFSHLLRIMKGGHVPIRMIFLLMVAYRFLSVFIREIRSTMHARSLRLFGRSALRGMGGTLSLMAHRALDYAESIYIAMRVRGGESSIPLLAQYHSHRYDTIIFVGGLLIILLPYFGIYFYPGNLL